MLGSQAHVVIRPSGSQPPGHRRDGFACIIEPRAQRLRSHDQWENIARLAPTRPASPRCRRWSPARPSLRGQASKSVALMGVDAERYRRIVRMEEYMLASRFAVEGPRA